jgi:hypothetical protein
MDVKGITRFINKGLKRSHTIVFFGNHGVGKTSFVKYDVREFIAKKEKVPLERVHVITKCVSIMDPADLLGNFQEFGGRTYNCPPNWLPVSTEYEDEMAALYEQYGKTYTRLTNKDDVYIIFLDECKRGNPIIQDSIMELILGHTIFGIPLHEKTYIFAADNEAKFYNGTKRDPAQISRLKNFSFMPTNAEFLAYFERKVSEGTIHPVILAYLRKHEDLIVLPTNVIEELAINKKKGPSPRDWEQLGETLLEYKTNDDDIIQSCEGNYAEELYLAEVARAYIGPSYSDSFANWCANEFTRKIDVNRIIEEMDEDLYNTLKVKFASDPKSAIPLSAEVVKNIVKRKTLTETMSHNIYCFMCSMGNAAIANFFQTWSKEANDQFTKWKHTPARHNICMLAVSSTESKNGTKSAYERWVENFTKRFNITREQLEDDEISIGNM